jgi:hypothetical protein
MTMYICECSRNASYKSNDARCPKCGAFGVDARTFISEEKDQTGLNRPKFMPVTKKVSGNKPVKTEGDFKRERATAGVPEKNRKYKI